MGGVIKRTSVQDQTIEKDRERHPAVQRWVITSAEMRMLHASSPRSRFSLRLSSSNEQTLGASFFFSRPPHRKKKGEEGDGASDEVSVSRDN